MTKFKAVFILVILGGIFFCTDVFGVPSAPVEENPPFDEPLDQKIIEEDIKATNKIDEAASKVDVWLAGKRIVDTTNLTKITLRNQFNWPSGGPFVYQPFLDLRLQLPNLEKKWQLKFITYNEDQERGINQDRLKTAPLQNSYAGSVGFIQKLGEVNMEFEPRFELNGGPQLSYFSRLTSSAMTPYFAIHPEVQLFAKSDSGIGEYFAANMDFPIYKTLVATLIDEEQYLDQANTFSTNLGGGFSYQYNSVISQGYTLIYELANRPVYQLNRYSIVTTFVHKLLKNVVHYTIQPYLAFNGPQYAISPGMNFELDFIF